MLSDCEQSIRERAYAIWEQEGRPHDRNMVHWLQAESEIGIGNLVRSTDARDARKSSRARRATHANRINRKV